MNVSNYTQSNAAVLQQVAQVVEHGFLVLATDATEVAQETATAGHHLGEGNLLWMIKLKHKCKMCAGIKVDT